MIREYKDYLDDIMDSIGKIESFTLNMNYDQFVRDDKTVYAVVRALEIIGEAVNKLPASIREAYPQLPWGEMIGMRNKLIHEYFGVDVRVLWQTLREDVPQIKPIFQEIINSQKK